MRTHHELLTFETSRSFELMDISAHLQGVINRSKIDNGIAVISSQHTTTALTVNEFEARLLDDIELFFRRVAPPEARYLHNDLHLRDCPPDEPENAHAHLTAMILGNSESLAVVNGKPQLGTYQSLIMAELDGPRMRQISVQIVGV